MQKDEYFKDVRADLDEISPTFCLAKWYQVTLHLESGQTHSCHHPAPHRIPLEGLKEKPSMLHNTPFKQEQRELMLKGERPAECSYCWDIEDTEKYAVSDRLIKSSESWSRPYLQEAVRSGSKGNISPKYLELNFGNQCNFACAYCNPSKSSLIMAEYQKHGHYKGSLSLSRAKKRGLLPYESGETNPYLEAFWKWFPDIVNDLKVLRLTGGEPLLNPNLNKLLDILHKTPQPNLQFAINSNLSVPDAIYNKFLNNVQKLTAENSISDFMLFASVDTHGRQAEYIRHGLDYKKFIENIHSYLERKSGKVTIMASMNILSISSFDIFLKDVLELKQQYNSIENQNVGLDIAYLRTPHYLSPKLADSGLRKKIECCISFMEDNLKGAGNPGGFAEVEVIRLRRILNFLNISSTKSYLRQKKFLFHFINDYDKRKKLSFNDTFPELKEFYDDLRSIDKNHDWTSLIAVTMDRI